MVPPPDDDDTAPLQPIPVTAIAAGRECHLIWQNVDALTYEVGSGADRCFVKWTPVTSSLNLDDEAERMAWAVTYTPVPEILSRGADETGRWIVTAPLPGRNAVDPRWQADPRTAVVAIGEGLRAMHESMPVSTCPFSWQAPLRVGRVFAAARANRMLSPTEWQPEHEHLTPGEALRLISDIPPADQVVVCHGDTCPPNTLLTDDGRWSGHVDLGALGVADRWADLAIATWSTEWNYGPGWEQLLLDAYGVPADPDRTRYYRLLWDLGE